MAKLQNPFISVIIPMYNSEKYIEECLQSLLNQTLKNIEILLVDDCSTDNSVSVAKKMIPAFSDKKIFLSVIKSNKNSGCPGIPRNTAINLAKGKYIYFLDSDDFLDENALEDFYNIAEEFNADVVHSEKFFTYFDNSNEEKQIESTQTGEFVEIPTLETTDVGKRIEDFIQGKYAWWGCNKLFRRDFILKNQITFPSMLLFEDLVFAFQCVVCAKNYVRVPFVNYHYRIREGSLSHNSPLTGKHIRNFLDTVDFFDSFMSKHQIFNRETYKYSFLDFFIQQYLNSMSENLFVDSNLGINEIYDFLYKEVFAVNSKKGAAFNTYIFISMNLYRILINRQAAEIVRLKNLLQDK